MNKNSLPRRDFLRTASAAGAAGLGMISEPAAGQSTQPGAEDEVASAAEVAPRFPQLAIRSWYSPQRLAFAREAGYQGIVAPLNQGLRPDLNEGQIQAIKDHSTRLGVRIISLEAMYDHEGKDLNFLAADPAERARVRNYFVRVLELGQKLGCHFVGCFSGGQAGASATQQVQALAAELNQHYLPACERLNMSMGPENWPAPINFCTTPGLWKALFQQVRNPRFGLEFDPSHLVRQYIDPYAAAWEFKERILASHAKDTEIIEPVLQQVGIGGDGWWRYRIPGQGIIDWPRYLNVLLQARFAGGIAVEHEDPFWDQPHGDDGPELAPARKDGFILAARFLRQFLPGRLA